MSQNLRPMARLRRLVLQPFNLPLLFKELQEQSSQRKTYLFRLIYGGVLLALSLYQFLPMVWSGQTASLGLGAAFFNQIATLQLWALYLVVPLGACGCLTEEKERNTLQLLLITTLSPGKIVLQKFLGRLTPILVYLCLSFPVLALAYSLGGVSVPSFWGAGVLLLMTAIQACGFSVACSAYCSTTIEALIWYTSGFFLSQLLLPFMWGGYWLNRLEQGGGWGIVIIVLVWSLISVPLALFFATSVLERRAALTPKNPLLLAFQAMDRFFNSLNRVTGDRILVRDGEPLPVLRPVAWRETAKKSLGTFRYLFRVLLVLQAPLIVVLAAITDAARPEASLNLVRWYLHGVLLIMAGMLIIHASGLISAERGRQTLQVLLSTPLTGRDLILQKQSGVLRLSRVMLVPILSILLFEAWWCRGANLLIPLLLMYLATVLILQRVLTWVTIWIGLRMSTQSRALVVAMAVAVAWWAVGQVGVYSALMALNNPFARQLAMWWVEMHPVTILWQCQNAINLRQSLPGPQPIDYTRWLLQAIGLGLHLALYLGIKHLCLSRSDRWLGRLSEPVKPGPVANNSPPDTPAPGNPVAGDAFPGSSFPGNPFPEAVQPG